MGIIKDMYDIGKDFLKEPLSNWASNKRIKEQILKSFSSEFLKHPNDITQLVDYYLWNEERGNWSKGSGRLLAASYKESETFWGVPERFSVYEAFLLRFLKKGGLVARVFVVGHELFDPNKERFLLKAVFRQYLLGFKPVVASALDLDHISRQLYVECDMFAAMNDEVAYFIKMNPFPVMIRTVNNKFIARAIKCHNELSDRAASFEKWSKRVVFKNDIEKIKKDVEKECAFIYEIAGLNSDDLQL